MIQKPSEKSHVRKVRILIAGYPGMGKTTLALSAPKPLMIDCDKGMYRSDSRHWAMTAGEDADGKISYETILADLTKESTAEFETLIFDTGGKLISLMAAWAIRKDPKYGQRDGSLSLKGYGAVGREFQRLMDYCYYELDKNIVMVFHATEDKDGDNTRLRIKAEGQTKNNVWECMDLGGFMEMIGNDRTIGFSNCERYFAKGTRGIFGVMRIPTLTDGVPNDFLTRLFEKFNDTMSAEASKAALDRAGYDAIMSAARSIIAGIKDTDGLAAAQDQLQKMNPVLSSRKETAALLKAKAKDLGFKFSTKSGWERIDG